MRFKIFIAAAIFSLAAPSAFAQQVGQLVSGFDYTGTKQHPLNIDSQGRLNVIGSASGGSVFGADAPNTTATQSPVRVAGCSVPLSNTCTVRNIVLDASGFITSNINGNVTVVGGAANAAVPAGNPVLVSGFDGTDVRYLATDTTGKLNVNVSGTATVTQTTAANLNAQVVGAVADGAVNSGNPVKVGCVGSTLPPTIVTGHVADLPCQSSIGAVYTTMTDALGHLVSISTGSVPGLVVSANVGLEESGGTIKWSDAISSTLNGAGNGVAAVSSIPNSSVKVAIVPVVSTAVESNHVLKASAGNLYRVRITTGATAGFLMLFNATTAPVDGAVTPQSCTAVPANVTVEIDHSAIPDRFSTGITAVFSSTGCFTKTASATAEFEGYIE